MPGRGWTTYDPTPADPGANQSTLMARAALFFDAADQFWQDWILSYNLDRQIVLASKVQQSGRGVKLHWMDSDGPMAGGRGAVGLRLSRRRRP